MVCRASLEAVFRSWVDFASQELSAVLERVDRCGVLVHEIDLFQGKSLGLIYHEINKSNAQEAASKPDEKDFRLQIGITRAIIHQIRGRVSDGPVDQPIGGSGDG